MKAYKLPELVTHIRIMKIPIKNLEFIPVATNYTIVYSLLYLNSSSIGNIYKEYHKSHTRMIDHLFLEFANSNCLVVLSKDQQIKLML